MPIRNATRSDVGAVADIQRYALPPNYPHQFSRNIGVPAITNLVEVVDQQVVGFITVLHHAWNPQGPAMWERMGPYVGFVAVLPRLRGSGIGTALLHEARRAVEGLGIAGPFWLECAEGSAEQRLYLRVGFVVVDPKEVESRFGMRSRGTVMRWD